MSLYDNWKASDVQELRDHYKGRIAELESQLAAVTAERDEAYKCPHY
jgi:uncharacterized protein YciW